jgi:hypothetical protein
VLPPLPPPPPPPPPPQAAIAKHTAAIASCIEALFEARPSFRSVIDLKSFIFKSKFVPYARLKNRAHR